MRVFSLVLVAFSALQPRADSDLSTTSLETREPHDSIIVRPSATHQYDIPSNKSLGSKDASSVEERTVHLEWLTGIMRWSEANAMERAAGTALRYNPPDRKVHSLPRKSIKRLKRAMAYLNNQKLLVLDPSTPVHVHGSRMIALLQRSEDSEMKALGQTLMNGLLKKWKTEEKPFNQVVKEHGFDGETVHTLTVPESLSDDVLRAYCTTAVYINEMSILFGGTENFKTKLQEAYDSEVDRARAVKLMVSWLEMLIGWDKAPHEAFFILGLGQYGKHLHEKGQLRNLMEEYVQIYNDRWSRKTTLKTELERLKALTRQSAHVTGLAGT